MCQKVDWEGFGGIPKKTGRGIVFQGDSPSLHLPLSVYIHVSVYEHML